MDRQNKSRVWVKGGKKKFYVEGVRNGRELIFPLWEGGENMEVSAYLLG